MHVYTMTADETALWEDDGPDGDDFRRALWRKVGDAALAENLRHVEIYSHDGVTMDAFDAN